MPYVDGESLRDRLDRDKQLPFTDATRILREVADALAYSHARGVVHRDIKPGNVLLSGRHAVVTDFGVAKALSPTGDDTSTTLGMAVGTPHYMAPEQAMGEGNVDHRADIYALGLLGYEMLAGRPTFEKDSAQAMLAAHVMETPADIQTVRPGTPPLLAEAIMRCLAKNRADRWQSAEELIARLEAISTTPSGSVTPTGTRPLDSTAGTAGAATRPSRSRRGLLIGIAAGVLLIGVGVGLFVMNAGGGSGGGATIGKIGVMPLEDISGQDAVFVAAMHDALTSALTRANLTGVAPRSAMMQYKSSTKTTQEIARELSLGAIVEATVFRAGDVMRINVQISDPVTTRVLWSDTYEKDVKNVLFEAGAVCDALHLTCRDGHDHHVLRARLGRAGGQARAIRRPQGPPGGPGDRQLDWTAAPTDSLPKTVALSPEGVRQTAHSYSPDGRRSSRHWRPRAASSRWNRQLATSTRCVRWQGTCGCLGG